MGSRHPAVVTVLQDYLKKEAQDKKGVEINKTSDVVGKNALVCVYCSRSARTSISRCVQVPAQPNYCDCGLYLIHFAQKFLEDPDRLAQIILVRIFGLQQTEEMK